MRTHQDEMRIIELYQTHMPHEITKVAGYSRSQIKETLKKHQVPNRWGRGSGSKRIHQYDRDLWFRILYHLYWELELPKTEVAKRVHLNLDTVSKRMDSLGIARRTPGEANTGNKRGTYNWPWPECEIPLCTTRVKRPGVHMCGRCRRNPARRKRLTQNDEGPPERASVIQPGYGSSGLVKT